MTKVNTVKLSRTLRYIGLDLNEFQLDLVFELNDRLETHGDSVTLAELDKLKEEILDRAKMAQEQPK